MVTIKMMVEWGISDRLNVWQRMPGTQDEIDSFRPINMATKFS